MEVFHKLFYIHIYRQFFLLKVSLFFKLFLPVLLSLIKLINYQQKKIRTSKQQLVTK